MIKIKNSILLPLILVCILIISIYIVVYFKHNRDIINETKTTVIENTKTINDIDSITNFKIKTDSIDQSKTDDSIIDNQNRIIKLLEEKKAVEPVVKKKNIFTKIKKIF